MTIKSNENSLLNLVIKKRREELNFYIENLADSRKKAYYSIGKPEHNYYREQVKKRKANLEEANKKWDERLDKVLQ